MVTRRTFGATWWGKAWVEALQWRAALDPNRPTVIVLDRALLAGAGDGERLRDLAQRAALIGMGEPGEAEPPTIFPLELLTSFIPCSRHCSAMIQCSARVVGCGVSSTLSSIS